MFPVCFCLFWCNLTAFYLYLTLWTEAPTQNRQDSLVTGLAAGFLLWKYKNSAVSRTDLKRVACGLRQLWPWRTDGLTSGSPFTFHVRTSADLPTIKSCMWDACFYRYIFPFFPVLCHVTGTGQLIGSALEKDSNKEKNLCLLQIKVCQGIPRTGSSWTWCHRFCQNLAKLKDTTL